MRTAIALAALAGLATAAPSQSTAPFGTCAAPVTRKEWRYLTKPEKKSFIDAVKCLGTVVPGSKSFYKVGWGGDIVPILPESERTLYDDLVYAHMDTNEHNHFVGLFFPWHRMVVQTFEKAIQDHCGYVGGVPYWDWTLDWEDLEHAAIFDSDPVYGLGTWGTEKTNWTITDGAFVNWTRPYPWAHTIQRRYTPQPYQYQWIYPFEFPNPFLYIKDYVSPTAIKNMIETNIGQEGALNFQAQIEGVVKCQGLHTGMHSLFGPQNNIDYPGRSGPGGDMGSISYSINDPIFFMHHANMDRIWQKWKDFDPRNQNLVAGGTIKNLTVYDTVPQGLPPAATFSDWIETSGLYTNVTIWDLRSTTTGYTCYTYEEPIEPKGDDF